MLKHERDYYDQNHSALMEKYANRVVLIKGKNLIGAFDTDDQALEEGCRLFGVTAFLVRRVTADAPAIIDIPSLSLGILNAGPEQTVPASD